MTVFTPKNGICVYCHKPLIDHQIGSFACRKAKKEETRATSATDDDTVIQNTIRNAAVVADTPAAAPDTSAASSVGSDVGSSIGSDIGGGGGGGFDTGGGGIP